jgi:hypothetical protein
MGLLHTACCGLGISQRRVPVHSEGVRHTAVIRLNGYTFGMNGGKIGILDDACCGLGTSRCRADVEFQSVADD